MTIQWTPSNLNPYHPCIQATIESPKIHFIVQINPWNVATPLIRTLFLVPRVVGLEGVHCNYSAVMSVYYYLICTFDLRLARETYIIMYNYIHTCSCIMYKHAPVHYVHCALPVLQQWYWLACTCRGKWWMLVWRHCSRQEHNNITRA